MKTIYFDMDGVIADFNSEKNAVERFAVEKSFFLHLKPIRQNLNALKMLIKQGRKVRVISASPNEQADKDKLLWLKEYAPELSNDNIIIVRNGQVKADFVDNIENSILFDDYGKNCREWEKCGGQAVKIKRKSQVLEMVVG